MAVEHFFVLALATFPVFTLLLPRDLGVNLELAAVLTEERNHLAGQWRVPATTVMVVAEAITTAGARRERKPSAAVGAVELREAATPALELMPDDMIKRHLRDCLVEELALGFVVLVDDRVEITAERHAENSFGARIVLVVAIVHEIGRILNVELHDGIPVVQNELVGPVVLGELHRLVHVLVGREHVAVRLAVFVGLGSPTRIRPVESCRMILSAGDARVLVAVLHTRHLDFLDPLLVIGDDLETMTDAKWWTGDVTGIGRERFHSFFGGEMRAQHGHVLRCRALDWELSENGTILLTFHIYLLLRNKLPRCPRGRVIS